MKEEDIVRQGEIMEEFVINDILKACYDTEVILMGEFGDEASCPYASAVSQLLFALVQKGADTQHLIDFTSNAIAFYSEERIKSQEEEGKPQIIMPSTDIIH